MFKALKRDPDDRADIEDGQRAATTASPRVPAPAAKAAGSPVILAFPAAPVAAEPAHPGLRAAIEAWCARVDLAPDLACDIGSRKWLRGLATMFGLGAAALALLPGFTAVEAAATMPLDTAQQGEFRSQSIAPLALGADTGRHMGATPLVSPLTGVPERPTLQLTSTLGQGDTLPRLLERAGLGSADVAQVTQLVSQVVPAGEIGSGTRFDITLGRRPAEGAARALDSLAFRARFDLDLSIERGAGGLMAVRHPIRIDETPLRIRGTVGSSLYRSARNAGAPVGAIQSYLRAVDKYLSLDGDVRAGDEFDMILAYKRSAKGEREVGDLLYAGVERGGKPKLQLMRWGSDGQMFAAGAIGQPRSVPIGQPVASARITSPYGARRHPILGYVRMHAGIDFGAPYGSPIYAVADGVVTFAGRHGGHGNYVRLQHSGGLGTGYGHMSRIAVGNGTRVRAGQVIGYVGSTGLSTGPHLHFEAYRGGRTINPAGIAVIQSPQIDGRERDAFKARLNALLGVTPGAALGSIEPVASDPVETTREIDKLAP
ncbi:M23 family metallopeptidase [Novosphingobium resinovorum]|uniref:M23 family metallopeptidase n=1 Tax=Novosphingobium resinovorum TaxID=158500 RepID=UPI002ED5D345|nr:M23 family metallopeptidase [Novosphingobium resinovorum]